MANTFDNILVWAFPASGKSETFKFIRELSPEERAKLHIGSYKEIDDYPLVASIFRVDNGRQAAGLERRDTREETYDEGGFLDNDTWRILDAHLVAEYNKMLALHNEAHKTPLHDDHTVLIECARGGAAGEFLPLDHGYLNTMLHMPDDLLEKAVIFYVQVAPETSRAKNDARYDPANPLSTLGHRVPTKVMERDYGRDDVSVMMNVAREKGREGYVESPTGLWIPIGVLDNETEDLTSFVRDANITPEQKEEAGEKLYAALEQVLPPLFERYQAVRAEREASK